MPALTLANVAITWISTFRCFNRAIEEKVKAEQEALKAKNGSAGGAAILLMQPLPNANWQQTQRRIKIEAASRARAEAIRREACITWKDNPELIQLRIAEKWNGQLPQVTAKALTLLNIDVMQGRL